MSTAEMQSNRSARRYGWLGVGLVLTAGLVLLAALGLAYCQFLGLGLPELYESHTAPGKPTVEIRWTYGGFMGGGSALDAYLVEGGKRKKVLTLLDNIASHFGNTTNTVARRYVLCTPTQQRLPIYQVAWSADARRVGVAYQGYFVAAYDRASGKRLELGNFAGDYRRCDQEIERFLQR